MFMLATTPTPSERPLFDARGRPLGRVVEPRTGRLTGRGAETVLLIRQNKPM